MAQRFIIVLAGVAAVACSHAQAQQVVVQQPQFEMFTAPTTVLVPDGGSAALGGVGSAAGGRVMNGPLRTGSASAFSRGASSARVHGYVHDFEAMDAKLLGEGAATRAPIVTPPPQPRRSGALWARPMRRPPAVAP
jgi:hypothetical protein